MIEYQGVEKRGRYRNILTTFCPASFEYNGKTYEALMSDLSDKGAGFKILGANVVLPFAAGEEITYTVRTPYGKSDCRAVTKWTQTDSASIAWGAQFTYLSEDKKDPLRCYIDSPF